MPVGIDSRKFAHIFRVVSIPPARYPLPTAPRKRPPRMEADLLGPRCEQCGSPLHFFTQEGRAVQDCDICGLAWVGTRHPTPVVRIPSGGFAPWARDAARDALIITMIADGRSRREISEAFDITPERVRQIVSEIQRDSELAGAEESTDAA